MDRITLHELEIFCRIGVPEAERATPQKLLVNLELELDLRRSASTDNLEQTINYHRVAVRVEELAKKKEWKLIETLAEDIAAAILSEFKPVRVTVEVRKFVLPQTKYVAVTISRPADKAV